MPRSAKSAASVDRPDVDGGAPALAIAGAVKSYGSRAGRVPALRGVDLAVAAGAFVAVMGPSGSGKSTLLRCAAGLEPLDDGDVRLAGVRLTGMREAKLAKVRRARASFVFQDFNLMPTLSVGRNVGLPLQLQGRRLQRQTLASVLESVGLAGKQHVLPAQLSGGQQQRVAIARALAQQAPVLFADEPTGALDRASGDEVLRLLRAAVATEGRSVLMVTHDPVAAALADRVLFLVDGTVTAQLNRSSAATIAARLAGLSS